ncbi:MAG: hypothetical protein M3299_15370 [Thermoproteota archaeon]|nr:hypothetical protein [Thermoproteota archaeon]
MGREIEERKESLWLLRSWFKSHPVHFLLLYNYGIILNSILITVEKKVAMQCMATDSYHPNIGKDEWSYILAGKTPF